jgi:hypothetical protein
MACQHDRLNFGSGDYYVMCVDCGAVWARMSGRRPEYGVGIHGKMIGTDPNSCTPGFKQDGALRVRPQ